MNTIAAASFLLTLSYATQNSLSRKRSVSSVFQEQEVQAREP